MSTAYGLSASSGRLGGNTENVVYKRLRKRFAQTFLGAPGEVLDLLVASLQEHQSPPHLSALLDETEVVRRLVETLRGNACCLPFHSCLEVMRLYNCLDSGSGHVCSELAGTISRAQSFRLRAQLSPLCPTLLMSVWGNVIHAQTDRKASGELLPTSQLPEMCATVLAFGAASSAGPSLGAGTSADPEVVLTSLVREVISPSLQLYFAEKDSDDVATRPSDVTAPSSFPVANHAGSPVASAMQEAWTWWELLLRATPLLSVDVAAAVSTRAWASLASLKHEVLRLSCSLGKCGGSENHRIMLSVRVTEAQNPPEPTAALLEHVESFLCRLPVLQCVGQAGACDESPTTTQGGDGAPDARNLLPYLVPLVRHILAIQNSGSKQRRRASVVGVLHRLVLEDTAASSVGEPSRYTTDIKNLVEEHFLSPSLTGSSSTMASTAQAREITVDREVRETLFDEQLWVMETSLVEWYRMRTAATATTTPSLELPRDWMLSLLVRGAEHLSRVDAAVTTAATSGASARLVADGVPSQAFLLRYMQCWQAWIASLRGQGYEHLLHTLLLSLERLVASPSQGVDVSRGSGAIRAAALGEKQPHAPAPRKKTETGDAGRLQRVRRVSRAHAQLLTRSMSRCLSDVSAPHVSPLLALHTLTQITTLLACVNDPVCFLAVPEAPVATRIHHPERYPCHRAVDANDHTMRSLSAATPAAGGGETVAETLLLTATVLRQLQRQCTSLFVRLRHHARAYSEVPRVGRARGSRSTLRDTTSCKEGKDNHHLFLTTAPSWEALGSREATGQQEQIMTMGEGNEERRRWRASFIPPLLACWTRLGGGVDASPVAVPRDGGVARRGGNGRAQWAVQGGAAYRPRTVLPFWDDAALLPFITALRSDVYDLESEVRNAFPRLVATALSDCCVQGLGVASQTLRDGIRDPRGVSSLLPFLVSLLGVPVALRSDRHGDCTAEAVFADLFVWQHRRHCLDARMNLTSAPSNNRGAAAPPPFMMAVVETEPTMQAFFACDSTESTSQETDPSAVPVDTLSRSFRQRHQDQYASEVLSFHALCFSSDGICRARASRPGRHEINHREEGSLRDQARGNATTTWHACDRPAPPRLRLGLLHYGTMSPASPIVVDRVMQTCLEPALSGESIGHGKGEAPRCGKPPSSHAVGSQTTFELAGRDLWPRDTATPWVALGGGVETNLQQLWKCLLVVYHRFQQAMHDDLAQGNLSQAQCIASVQARQAGGAAYARHLHDALLASLDANGELEVSTLASTVLVPYMRWRHTWVSKGSGVDSTKRARRVLRILLLTCPVATFSMLAPSALMELWQVAVGGASCAAFEAPAHQDGGETLRKDNGIMCESAEDIDFLVSAYTILRLAQKFDLVKRETCAFVTAMRNGSESDVTHATPSPSAPDENAKGLDAFVVLDILATQYREGAAGGATERNAVHPFSKESIAFAEVLSRATVYDVHTVVKALREFDDTHVASSPSERFFSPEVIGLVRQSTQFT